MGRIDQETADTEGGHKNIKKNRPAHAYVFMCVQDLWDIKSIVESFSLRI